jgi:hypothetical protein
MGTPFRWLVGSSWVGNLGDGTALAAGPLLVAGQTQDAFFVALGALLQRLPWLLFGGHAGVLTDRVDRRRLVITVDLARAGVLTTLFVLGAAEVFADTTPGTLLPKRAVPLGLQGRVGSLYVMGVFGGILLGQLIGGLIAQVWGVSGPFWFGFAGSAVILALIWRQLAHIAHAGDDLDQEVRV